MTEPQPPTSPAPTPASTPPVPEWDPGVSRRFDETGPATAAKGSRGRALGAVGALMLLIAVIVLKSQVRTWLDRLFH